MRVRLIVVACLCCAAIALQAARVSPEQAQRTASTLLRAHASIAATISYPRQVTPTMHRVQGVDTPAPVCYIFNAPSAFAIVAADDRLPAVLGYSDKGTLNESDMPPALTHTLALYARVLERMDDAAPTYATTVTGEAIDPMLKSRWSQGAPFNLSCPWMPDSTHAMTGSVATALAQVMLYHKWPVTPTYNIHAYASQSLMLEMPELPVEDFPKWSSIKDYYIASDTTSDARAASQLMLYCGQSVMTNYGTPSTASPASVPYALTNYFDYAQTAKYVARNQYSAQEWTQLLYDELKAHRPVIYRGQTLDGQGQSFVCDGYDGNGMFHINWGWHGLSDGYYALPDLYPAVQEALCSSGYVVNSGMVMGIKPGRMDSWTNPGQLAFYDLTIDNTTYSRTSPSTQFTGVTVGGRFNNVAPQTSSYDYGFALYDEAGQLVKTVYSNTFIDLYPNYGKTGTWELDIDPSVASGTYSLRAVSRLHGTSKWNQCLGTSVNYVKATINGNTLTLQAMGDGGTPQYEITSVNLNGTKLTGRQLDIEASVTNKGTSNLSYIYLLDNDEPASVALCDIASGKQGTIAMHITPTTAGMHTLKFSLDKAGTQVIYTTTANIANSPDASLKINVISIENCVEEKRNINSDSFNATFSVLNTGSNDYHDDIVASLYRHTGHGQGTLLLSRTLPASLVKGGHTTLNIDFDEVVASESYSLHLSYYNQGKLVEGTTTPFYTLLGSFLPGDVNCDHLIDVSDLNCVINVILGLQTPSYYNGHSDATGDGVTDIADINMIINTILGL